MDWKKVGVIGVDAGLCWVGDPCYIIHSDDPPKELGSSWSALYKRGDCNRLQRDNSKNNFCDILYDKEDKQKSGAVQFNYDLDHPGLGVCCQTGYGDGEYDVFVKKNKEGLIAEVKVVFIDEEEEDNDW